MRPEQNAFHFDKIFVNYPLIVVFAVITLLGLFDLVYSGFRPVVVGIIALAIIFLVLLYSVRILVESGTLLMIYGVGAIVREFSIGEIGSVSIEKNKALFAWLFNPYGDHILLITLRGGGKVAVPSNAPKHLAAILQFRM